jgi:molybdopterin molybdotransferase
MSRNFEEALDIILKNVKPTSPVLLPLAESVGRVLAADVVAPCDLPSWDNSAMDGYAVRVDDCRMGAVLQVTGFIQAGGRGEPAVKSGCAVKIMTGAPVPPGAEAVVPVEETEEMTGQVRIVGKVKPRDHIRFRGEDISSGEEVIPSGRILRSAEISLLATMGMTEVPVYRPVRVAVLSTGDELVETSGELVPGKIIDSNSPALAAAISLTGAEPVRLGFAGDTVESLREKLLQGLQLDALVTSAGVSAGDLDLVRNVLEELGVRQFFWKVAIKPGRPTAFGLFEGKPVFSLPGNPVSSLLTFEQFVRPALLKMMGHVKVLRPLFSAKLAEPLAKKSGRTFFVRVRLFREQGQLFAVSAGDQNTGILKTLIDANAVAVLPMEKASLAAGEEVRVYLLDDRDYGLLC